MSAEVQHELTGYLVEQVDKFAELIDQRNEARAERDAMEQERDAALLAAEAAHRRLADQERHNIESRRSLCAQSDAYLARAIAAETALAQVQS